MLAAPNRLTFKSGLVQVKSKGKIVQGEDFAAIYLKKKADEPSRFGFIVSTKISKEAAHRNRIKRAMREGVRQNMYILAKGIDVLFITKPKVIRMTTEEIMGETVLMLKTLKRRVNK